MVSLMKKELTHMLSVLALLLFQGNFFTLRMNTGGSFPRPLKPEEERVLLEQAAAGDLAARNKLIEHNLRLVAHIVKKRKSESAIFRRVHQLRNHPKAPGTTSVVPGASV